MNLFKISLIKYKAALLTGCVLLSVVSPTYALADALSEGGNLIRKMSIAMRGLDYSGAFVYAHGGQLESIQILHSNSAGVERERLVSLNGEAKEIVRTEDGVFSVSPGRKPVTISKSTPRTPFPEFEPEQLAQLEKVYAFNHQGTDRVADRMVEIIDLKPLDDYRYGYRLSIDSETHLLLRSDMKDNNGAIVEQVMFTEIVYLDGIPANKFLSASDSNAQSANTTPETTTTQAAPENNIDDMNLPDIAQVVTPYGFDVMSDKVLELHDNFIARRIMYTDGLASVSIYVTPSSDRTDNELQGVMGMGAVKAYGVMHDQWHVTVVGEVPKSTVMMIGDSVTLTE